MLIKSSIVKGEQKRNINIRNDNDEPFPILIPQKTPGSVSLAREGGHDQ